MPLDPKTCKNKVFFNGFEKAVFWSLKLLMALCVHLGCFLGKSGLKMGFQNGYQKWRKKESKNREAINSNNLIIRTCVNFWSLFGLVLGIILKPILEPKICSKCVNFWVNFGSLFWGFRSSLGGLKSEKMQTVPRENHFFENVAFLVFEALVRKWVPKWSPKGVQKVTKKWSTKSSKK